MTSPRRSRCRRGLGFTTPGPYGRSAVSAMPRHTIPVTTRVRPPRRFPWGIVKLRTPMRIKMTPANSSTLFTYRPPACRSRRRRARLNAPPPPESCRFRKADAASIWPSEGLASRIWCGSCSVCTTFPQVLGAVWASGGRLPARSYEPLAVEDLPAAVSGIHRVPKNAPAPKAPAGDDDGSAGLSASIRKGRTHTETCRASGPRPYRRCEHRRTRGADRIRSPGRHAHDGVL